MEADEMDLKNNKGPICILQQIGPKSKNVLQCPAKHPIIPAYSFI